MYIKSKSKKMKQKQEQSILKQAQGIREILQNGILQQKLEQYEVVRQQGYYNMLDNRARRLTGLSEEDYKYILENYTKLITKFPDTKEEARKRLDYIKSAQIAKTVALYGCARCIKRVSEKLDITVEDLCEECTKLINS